MATMRIIVEGVKCARNVVNKILTTTLMTVISHVNVPIVMVIVQCMQDLVRVKSNNSVELSRLNTIKNV